MTTEQKKCSERVANAIYELRDALKREYGEDFSYRVAGKGHTIAESSVRCEILPEARAALEDARSAEAAREALISLVKTINNTGGVVVSHSGTVEPIADPDWTDLGDAYRLACDAIGEPMVAAERSE